jgi:hypothetical protein
VVIEGAGGRNSEQVRVVTAPCVPSMNTWGSIYRIVRINYYNAGNAPFQLVRPKTRRSWGHYGLLSFTKIFVPYQLQLNTCWLVNQLPLRGPWVIINLHHDLLSSPSRWEPHRSLGPSLPVKRTKIWTTYVIGEGLMCETELRREFPCRAPLHMPNIKSSADTWSMALPKFCTISLV